MKKIRKDVFMETAFQLFLETKKGCFFKKADEYFIEKFESLRNHLKCNENE